MRVDVQLDDSELALLSGYNRSTTMGIKKPGELQRELLSDMENIEEKREVQAAPEEQGNKQGADAGTVEPKEVVSASEDKEEEAKSAPVRVRSDFLSMLSAMAQPNTHEDKDSGDAGGAGEDTGILPEEDESVLPEDEDEEDESVLPEDEDEDEDAGVLPEDEDEEDVGILPEDEGEEDESVLPEDDEEEDVSTLPADDGGAEGESVASEESTMGIPEQQEDEGDEYSSELPEDDDDEEYSSELPSDEEDSSELPEDDDDEEDSSEFSADEEDSSELPSDEDDEEDSSVLPDDDEDEYSVLPADEDDEEDAGVLPDDEDEESSVLPEDSEEVEGKPTPAGIQETAQPTPNAVEHPVSPSPKAQKSVHHAANQPTAHPAGYSAPSVPLYDFILNNGGSMLIEDVRKYYPIDEVKKALSLGKIYRFGNHVGV